MIPAKTKEAIDRYVNEKILPGGFLQSVLSNNLMGAFGGADDENRKALPEILAYVWNKIPARCCGSPERVRNWVTGNQEPKDSIGE